MPEVISSESDTDDAQDVYLSPSHEGSAEDVYLVKMEENRWFSNFEDEE